jgi:hypothetical protein
MLEPGYRHKQLTVKELIETHPKQGKIYRCICDCGGETRTSESKIRRDETSSCRKCGSLRAREKMKRHGMTDSPEWNSWHRMMGRCIYTNEPIKVRTYRDKGRVVVSPLDQFEEFYKHIGPKPSPQHTVDRIDNDLPYQIGNIRWATWKEQANNRSNNRLITIDGVTKTLKQCAEEIGFTPEAIAGRLKRGYTVEQALSRTNFSRREDWRRRATLSH